MIIASLAKPAVAPSPQSIKHENGDIGFNRTRPLLLLPSDVFVRSSTSETSYSRLSSHMSFIASHSNKTHRERVQAHIKTHHASRHSVVYEGVTYSIKIAEWNPEEDACYHYTDVKGRVIKIYPCIILSKIYDKDSMEKKLCV